MALNIGDRIGGYEVASAIGAGGMGEVYRARDTRLNRDVALKVLPENVSQDPDRRSRFEREAQLLAALNHSNIAAIYGIEETDGRQTLVMEFVAIRSEGSARGQDIQVVVNWTQELRRALGR